MTNLKPLSYVQCPTWSRVQDRRNQKISRQDILQEHKQTTQIYKKSPSIFTFTEDGLFASLSTFQYCVQFVLRKHQFLTWKVLKFDSWNLCCIHFRIWTLRNLGANPEIGSNLTQEFSLLVKSIINFIVLFLKNSPGIPIQLLSNGLYQKIQVPGHSFSEGIHLSTLIPTLISLFVQLNFAHSKFVYTVAFQSNYKRKNHPTEKERSCKKFIKSDEKSNYLKFLYAVAFESNYKQKNHITENVR